MGDNVLKDIKKSQEIKYFLLISIYFQNIKQINQNYGVFKTTNMSIILDEKLYNLFIKYTI